MTDEEFNEYYANKLNKQQKEAVSSVDGAILLLAVPGSGKTTVLITRLGYMIYCKNIHPTSILTMTYTVAATREMKNRFSNIFGQEYAQNMEFRTINGISAKIIEFYSKHHGKGVPFTLLENDGDASRAIREIYSQLFDDYPTDSTIKDIRTSITYIKNMMLNNAEIAEMDTNIKNIDKIYAHYREYLKQNRLMDYDDQMIYALEILKHYPSVLEYFQDKFRYFCVDESQDTSKIQHEIIKLLAGKHGNIFMVGDEDQSIYGFRAAYPQALTNFRKDYENAKILLMEENFRSTEEIVSVANSFVEKNQLRYEKKIKPTRGTGAQIGFIHTKNRRAQYKYLFSLAKICTTETAVLYRNNDSAIPLIDMFERFGVSYSCRKFDEGFFSHRIINDIIDIINFAYDPYNYEIFMHIYYKLGSSISKNAAEFACSKSRNSGKTILEELVQVADMKPHTRDLVTDLLEIMPEVTKGNAVQALKCIWNGLRYNKFVTENNLDAGKFFILCMLGEEVPTAKDLIYKLGVLRDKIKNHVNPKDAKFLLSTIHSAKGLEFDAVYLLDVLDGVFPTKTKSEVKTSDDFHAHEEERRLFYVAVTRAINELYVFKCDDKKASFVDEIESVCPEVDVEMNDIFAYFYQNLCGKTYVDEEQGRAEILAQYGVSFLVEYDNKKIELLKIDKMFEKRSKSVKLREKTKELVINKESISAVELSYLSSMIEAGGRVVHKTFGNGIVLSINGDTAEIHFEKSDDTKKLSIDICVSKGLLKAEL